MSLTLTIAWLFGTKSGGDADTVALTGLSWGNERVIWPACTAGYSGLTVTPHGLVLIFEGGSDCGHDSYSFMDTWIKVVTVPFF